MKLIKDFLHEESGMTAAEYGIILGLIGIAMIVAIGLLYTELGALFNSWANWFKGRH